MTATLHPLAPRRQAGDRPSASSRLEQIERRLAEVDLELDLFNRFLPTPRCQAHPQVRAHVTFAIYDLAAERTELASEACLLRASCAGARYIASARGQDA